MNYNVENGPFSSGVKEVIENYLKEVPSSIEIKAIERTIKMLGFLPSENQNIWTGTYMDLCFDIDSRYNSLRWNVQFSNFLSKAGYAGFLQPHTNIFFIRVNQDQSKRNTSSPATSSEYSSKKNYSEYSSKKNQLTERILELVGIEPIEMDFPSMIVKLPVPEWLHLERSEDDIEAIYVLKTEADDMLARFNKEVLDAFTKSAGLV